MSRVKLATAALLSALGLEVIGQEASTFLARVQALSLESLPGPVVAYYSPGARDRAASLSSRLSEALAYYDNHLGIAPTLALAVLNEAHWKQVRSSPYGVPGVRGAPYVAFLPSDLSRSVVVTGWSAPSRRPAPRSERALAAAGVSNAEAPYRLNDLIGFHEVGHVVIWEYGLRQTQRWFDEMLATFVAYAFLSDRHADEARVWDALMQRHIESLRPDFRDLDLFNARVDELPMETFGWYQAMVHQRAAEVYKTAGLQFLPALRKAGLTADVKYATAADLLERLEEIAPGFERWARTLAER
jgi:hypothetical protein